MRLRTLTVTAVALLSIGSGAAMMAAPAIATDPPSLTAAPNTNLKNHQTVTITAANFTEADSTSHSLLVVECSAKAKAYASTPSKALSYCDTKSLGGLLVDDTGAGSGPYKVVGGASYADAKHDKCDGTHPCIIVAATDVTGKQVAYADISFAKSVITPGATKTVVTGPKTGTAGHKVKVVAKTTTSAPKAVNGPITGTVVFTDNGKKVASVRESAGGKVSAKVKLAKGKNKIVASYKGSTKYLSSKGSVKVTGK